MSVNLFTAVAAEHDSTATTSVGSDYTSGEVTLPGIDGPTRTLKLGEAITISLQQNLDIMATSQQLRATEALYNSRFSIYDPLLKLEYAQGETRELLNTLPLSDLAAEYTSSALSLQQGLPLGTRLQITAETIESDEDPDPAAATNPYHRSRIGVSLLQPLLKGGGQTVTEEQIVQAAKVRQLALQELRRQAFDVVGSVRDTFFDALQAQYELSYRESSVALARRIVRENVARVAAGILPPVEKLEAEVGLQSRERLLLDARRRYADSVDRFNLLLNAEGVTFVPLIQAFTMDFEASEQKGVTAALVSRPDVITKMKQIERRRLEQAVARNGLLPEVNLKAEYSRYGLGASGSESFDLAEDGDYDAWQVGVELSYPLFNIEGRHGLKKIDFELRQQRYQLAQLRNTVRSEVRAAVRSLDVSLKKTAVAEKGHALAQEKLRILLKSREAGLATTRDVLDGEEDLASARTEQIAAVAEYFRAITAYLQVTGTLLEAEAISLRAEDADPSGSFFRKQH